MKKLIIAVVAIFFIGGGMVLLFSNKKDANKTPDTATQTSSQSELSNNSTVPPTQNGTAQTPAETPPAANVATTIVYTDNGFENANYKIKSGETVLVQNKSSRGLQLSSDPHPSHTDNRELNQNTLPPGGSQTFILTTKGIWAFHDHLQASIKGTIGVE